MNNLQIKGTGESNVPIKEQAEVKNWEDNQPLCLGGAGASLAVLLVVVQVGGPSPQVLHHVAAWFGAAAIPIWLAMWILSDTNAFWSAKGIENASKRPWYLRSGLLFALASCGLFLSIFIFLCASFPVTAGILLSVALICAALVVSHSVAVSASAASKNIVPESSNEKLTMTASVNEKNDAASTDNVDTGRALETWFFYRSRFAGCAAFTFALFLAISQIKSEACSWAQFSGLAPGCPLRYAMFTALYSSGLWFAAHIAATSYDQFGEKSLDYLKKQPFRFIWRGVVVFAALGSFIAVTLFTMHFSMPAARAFAVLFLFGGVLVAAHESRVGRFVKDRASVS